MKTGKRYYLPFALAVCALASPPSVAAEEQTQTQAYAEEGTAIEKLRRSRDGLSAVGEHEAALEMALRIVETLEQQPDVDMSEDLLELAVLQARLGDYEAAERNFLRVIGARESAQGIFSPTLIAPFHGLGRTYIDAGRFDEAVAVLSRAQTISQRTQGLFNLEQIPLIDDMTRAQLEAGNTSAAHALQLKRLNVAVRRFGEGAADLVPFHRHLGDYYYERPSDYYEDWRGVDWARYHYEQALAISTKHSGDSSPASLELLRRLTAVELYRKRRAEPSKRLAAALGADVGAKERGLSLAMLGDWATVNDDTASAEHHYAQAYAALRAADDVDADDFFAAPKMLDFVPPADARGRGVAWPGWRWGTIELAVDVSAAGRATAVRTISMDPPLADLQSDYVEQVSEAYFRPRLEQGRAIAGADARYVFRFRYRGLD